MDIRHYIIVPDKYTLYVERLLCDNMGGAIDAEVLTFSRLFYRLCENKAEFLPRSGAIMLIKKLIRANLDKFVCFGKSVKFKGFAEKLYDTICALSASAVEPSDLQKSLSPKFADIGMIYEQYLHTVEGKFVDSAGRSRLLYSEISSLNLKNTHFYICGFDKLSVLEQKTIERLGKNSGSVTEFITKPPTNKYGEVEFYEAEDIVNQLKASARQIRHNVIKNGYKYSDMCILSSSLDYDATKRILNEFDIPFFIDKKLNLLAQPLSAFIMTAYTLVSQGYKRSDYTALVKNFYFGISDDESDIFENYVNKFCIDYKGFFNEFSFVKNMPEKSKKLIDYENELLLEETAEKVRSNSADFLAWFSEQCRLIKSGNDFYIFINNLLSRLDAFNNSDVLSENVQFDFSQIPSKVLETAALAAKTQHEGFVYEDIFELFFEGLNSVEISFIPPKSDAVVIGDAATFRAQKFKQIFAIDFCEGVMPPIYSDDSVITDSETEALLDCGVRFEPKTSELNRRAKNELAGVLASTDKLFIAYSSVGEKRLSDMAYGISQGAKHCKNSNFALHNAILFDEDMYLHYLLSHENDYPSEVARLVSSKGNAAEIFIQGTLKEGFATLAPASAIREAAGEDFIDSMQSKGLKRADFIGMPSSIFFRNSSVSISRIQEYFACPYKHFLRYGLALVERESGEISQLDTGNFLHKAVENFINLNDFDDPYKSMKSVVDNLLEQELKGGIDANKGFYERLCGEACNLACKIIALFRCGSFKKTVAEINFDDTDNSKLKTVELRLYNKSIYLMGKIDRVDYYNDYASIIDYKTGSAKSGLFSYSDLYYGTKLQLLAYSYILKKNNYKPAGVFYFPLKHSWRDGEVAHRLNGIYNDSDEVLRVFDVQLDTPGHTSNVISAKRRMTADKKSGLFGLDERLGKKYRCCESQLESLADYAFDAIHNACLEIEKGYIKPTPSEGVCEYCVYGSICGDDKAVRMRADNSLIDADFIASYKDGGEA